MLPCQYLKHFFDEEFVVKVPKGVIATLGHQK